MAGTEIFGKEEIMAAADVIERRMIHRYGSHAERTGVYRAEEFEAISESRFCKNSQQPSCSYFSREIQA